MAREQRTITFAVNTLKRSTDPSQNNNTEEEAKKARLDDDDETTEKIEEEAHTEVTNEDIMKELLSTKELIVSSLKRDETPTATWIHSSKSQIY